MVADSFSVLSPDIPFDLSISYKLSDIEFDYMLGLSGKKMLQIVQA